MGPNGAEPTSSSMRRESGVVEPQSLAWYALAVRSRCEKGVATELQRMQVEHFLPLRSVRRIWRDRIKVVEMAYFPGYVFARSTLVGRERYRIVDLSDVVCVVGHSRERAGIAIPEREIENVRQLVERAPDPQPCAAIACGTRVVVAAGPLKGIEGVVETHKSGRQRIVCSITLLNRAVRAEIDAESLIPLTELESGLAGRIS
jgi:transcription antitermination factor NusG